MVPVDVVRADFGVSSMIAVSHDYIVTNWRAASWSLYLSHLDLGTEGLLWHAILGDTGRLSLLLVGANG